MSKLKLLARLHGQGFLIWPGSSVSVTYDVDVFDGGSVRTASGFLDGDFAGAYDPAHDSATGAAMTAARLRLQTGGEIAVQIIVVAADLAEFEAPLTPSEAGLLLSHG